MFKLTLLAALVSVSVAGGSNKCPWVIGKSPFDEQKMIGTWYAIAATPYGPGKGNLKCNKFDYQVTKDSHVLGFSGVTEGGKTIQAESIGTPMFGKPEKAASANFMNVWRKGDGSFTGVYNQAWVATDYDNYAVLISCAPIFDEATKTFNRHLNAGIMSRQKTLSNETLHVLKNVVSSYNVDISTVQLIDHSNC